VAGAGLESAERVQIDGRSHREEVFLLSGWVWIGEFRAYSYSTDKLYLSRSQRSSRLRTPSASTLLEAGNYQAAAAIR
jgi:hypothetical protein